MRKREAQSAALTDSDIVLEWAISKGFERFVQSRIAAAPLNWNLALNLAIEQDQLEITRNLIRGADPAALGARMVYPDAPSPVALAVQHDRVLILHEMLYMSPDADLTALLIYSARMGSTNVLEYLHRRGASLDATKTKVISEERTVTNALIEAVLYDQEEVVEYLLRNRASPDMPADKHGNAPLVVAVQAHNLRLTMMLLMAGARTAITDMQGNSLMQLAVAHAPCIARLLVRVNGYRAMNENAHPRKRRYSAPENNFAVKYAK
jgi:ankyrin repeat protein